MLLGAKAGHRERAIFFGDESLLSAPIPCLLKMLGAYDCSKQDLHNELYSTGLTLKRIERERANV